MSLSIIQGCSHDQTYTCSNCPDLASPYWVGTWAIVASLGSVAIAEGGMTKNSDNTAFELHLAPSVMETVPVGNYYLVAQMSNDVIGYKGEVQEKLTIKAQGIPG